MSDEDANSTLNMTYDYTAYYDGISISPCDDYGMIDFGRVFLPVLYSLVFILGFIGNGLVVCVLVKYRNQANLTDICLFNLALSDLLFVITLPFYAHYAMAAHWPFGVFLCRLIGGANNTGFFSSIFFMVVMTLDRYVVTMYNNKVARYRTVRSGIALTVCVWMLSLCVSMPTYIFTVVTNESGRLVCVYSEENKGWEVYNILTTNILGLVIPLLVMVICYSRILPILINLRSAKKYRIVKLIISIMLAFFLFWVPYNISLFLRFLHEHGTLLSDCNFDTYLRLSITVTETFAFTHCCLNPIIYAFAGQRFMKRVVQLLRKWVNHLPSTAYMSDTSFRKSSVMSRSSDVTSTVVM